MSRGNFPSGKDSSNMARTRTRHYNQLTPREREILKLISDGFSNREIAEFIGVSTRTVESHRARLMIKLNIYDVPGLVKYAIREGITEIT
jgi:DNA-binding NarL/FixJ family response regulator